MTKKPNKPAPVTPASEAEAAAETETATLEQLAAEVAEGGATAVIDGETVEVLALDVEGAPDLEADVTPEPAPAREPGLYARPMPVVETLALGAPGTQSVLGEDGVWRALPMGEA